MKKAHILHNPAAGSQEKSKKDLVNLIRRHGFDCGYSSTKKIVWKDFDEDPDFLVVAGGDGTVRKVAINLLQKERFRKNIPILLLPLGTANNVAKSLGINNGDIENLEAMFEGGRRKKYDVGRVSGIKKGTIFLESFGFGVFPELMRQMKEIPERKDATPEQNIEAALEVLHQIITTVPAQPYTVKIDDMTHSENYLLVEVMNTPSFGPNLNLSRDSDPGDGLFELVMIPETQREEFASYVSHKINGTEKTFKPVRFRGQNISIFGGPGPVHVDDELLELKKPKKITIRAEPGMMDFFVQ